MSGPELDDFLRRQLVGTVCGYGESGELTARRCQLTQYDDRIELKLWPPDGCFDLARSDRVCVIVDTYPSHDGIKGIVVSGVGKWSTEAALMSVIVRSITSFDFSKAVSPEAKSTRHGSEEK